MSSLRALNNVVDRLGHAPVTLAYECVDPRCENVTKMPSRSQFNNQHYCLSKYYC